MSYDPIPELQALPEAERMRVRLALVPRIFKDPRVWGAYLAQVAGFVLLFFVILPASPYRMWLVLGYALPTMLAIRALQRRVLRGLVVAFLAAEAQAR